MHEKHREMRTRPIKRHGAGINPLIEEKRRNLLYSMRHGFINNLR